MKTVKKTKARKKAIPTDLFTANYIQPLIRDGSIPHALESLEAKEKMPIMKATGVCNLDKTKGRQWISYSVTFQANQIISIEVSEPGSMTDATMTGKIAFQEAIESEMDKS